MGIVRKKRENRVETRTEVWHVLGGREKGQEAKTNERRKARRHRGGKEKLVADVISKGRVRFNRKRTPTRTLIMVEERDVWKSLVQRGNGEGSEEN